MTTFACLIFNIAIALILVGIGRIYQYNYGLPRISEADNSIETSRRIRQAEIRGYVLAEKLFRHRRNQKRDKRGKFVRSS